IKSGPYHTLAITERHLVGWGYAESTGNMGFVAPDIDLSRAQAIALPFPVDVIAVGYGHGCLLSNGVVHCFGGSYEGQLAGRPLDGGFTADGPIEATLLTGRTFTRLCASTTHYSCGVESSGTLVCWGQSTEGGTGNSDSAPFDVMKDVADVSCR